VGTELLLGQIANTNAQHISQSLSSIGIDVYFHVAVGDNLERVADTVRTALGRSDVVLITGGLGPTPDDLTSEAVAKALGVGLERDEAMATTIRAIFDRMGREMPEENLKQADLPAGAVPIPPRGTAPGYYIEREEKLVAALPGVPWEMKEMLAGTVIPLLEERSGEATTISRQILVLGLGESATHQKIADIVDRQTNPTIAYLAGGGQVRVRLTAKARTESEALALIGAVEAEIRARLGDAAVAGHPATLGEALGHMLSELGCSIGAVESLTGGLIGSQLTHGPGSSEYFKGSLITYSTEAKRDVAGLDPTIIEGPGVVSEAAAVALARSAAERFGADLGIAATGVAGPTEQEGKPVGTIFVAAHMEGEDEVRHVRGYGDRDNVRLVATYAALDLARRMLLKRG
jgi:nicotinamide-nucleotide amidase